MSTFFKTVSERDLISDALSVYDWLFDDTRFTGAIWDAASKRRFTNGIKCLNGFGENTFKKKSDSDSYPIIRTKRNRKRTPFALFSCDGSMGQEFVRHVRNAIAHGHADIYKINGDDYIELVDYGKRGQTSYIAMPISYINSIHRLYCEVERGKLNNRRGRRW